MDHKEITDQKRLQEIESLWSEWVDYEKCAINATHSLISYGKSPIQNPCSHSREDIINFIKGAQTHKNQVFEENQKKFKELMERTVNILKKDMLS